eukprot:290350_1
MILVLLSLYAIHYVDGLNNCELDQITSWNKGSAVMPFASRSQAVGYDPYTGTVHFLGGACPTCQTFYHTYDTIADSMSSLQSIPNNGRTPDQPYAHFYVQLSRILYMYNNEDRCIDTFDMQSLTFTSCWSAVGSIIPTNAIKGCLAVDDTSRYFFVIPETNAFFFYDTLESTWYSGPSTIQTAHLFPGCHVVNDHLFFWGGQVSWGQGGSGVLSLESLDVSDMTSLKANPSLYSWSITHNFLPFEHDFVRDVRSDCGSIYSVGGYRYSGDSDYIEVLAINLASMEVQQSVDIPTYGIGGSFIFDSCERRFYYFGGYDGSTDLDSMYISNAIDDSMPSQCVGYSISTTEVVMSSTDSFNSDVTSSTSPPPTTVYPTTVVMDSCVILSAHGFFDGEWTQTGTSNGKAYYMKDGYYLTWMSSLPRWAVTDTLADNTRKYRYCSNSDLLMCISGSWMYLVGSEWKTDTDATVTACGTALSMSTSDSSYVYNTSVSSSIFTGEVVIGISVGGSVVFVLCIAGILYILCNKTRNSPTKSGSVSLIKTVATPEPDCTTVIVAEVNHPNEKHELMPQDSNNILSVQLNEEDTLPYGWVKIYTSDNRSYYQNNVTKKTQWTMPSHSKIVPMPTSVKSTDNGASTADGIHSVVKVAIVPSVPSAPPQDVLQMEEEGASGNPMETSGYINSEKEDGCIKQFFEGVHLLEEDKIKYFKLFIVNGFDSLEIIKVVSNQDLLDIGVVKLGHRKIILSKAQQLCIE